MYRPTCFSGLSIAVALGAVCCSTAHAQFGPAPVVVTPAIEREVAPTKSFVATVRPWRKSTIGTAVDGRVDNFLFDEDNPQVKLSRVAQGQLMVKLKLRTITAMVDAARETKNLRESEYQQARDTFQPLKDQAQRRMQSARAEMEYADQRYARTKLLFDNGRSVSSEELQLAESNRTKARKAFEEAEINFELAKLPHKVNQAEAQFKVAQAELDGLEDRYLKYTIAAPFEGYIVAEHTDVGEWVTAGDPLVELVQIDPVEVRAYVPEGYVSHLREGADAEIQVSALPDKLFQGRITAVIAQADDRSRTFPVKVQVPNPGPHHLLKPGMLAHAMLEVGEKVKAVLVPKDALVLDQAQARLYLAVASPKDPSTKVAKMVPVQTGISYGRLIQVIGNVKDGDLVVELGNERLRPGSPLKVTLAGE